MGSSVNEVPFRTLVIGVPYDPENPKMDSNFENHSAHTRSERGALSASLGQARWWQQKALTP